MTPTQLRADLFHLLDLVLETGEPLEIRRKGRVLKIVSVDAGDKLGRIRPRRDLIVGDPEALVDPPPSEWEPDRALNP